MGAPHHLVRICEIVDSLFHSALVIRFPPRTCTTYFPVPRPPPRARACRGRPPKAGLSGPRLPLAKAIARGIGVALPDASLKGA